MSWSSCACFVESLGDIWKEEGGNTAFFPEIYLVALISTRYMLVLWEVESQKLLLIRLILIMANQKQHKVVEIRDSILFCVDDINLTFTQSERISNPFGP